MENGNAEFRIWYVTKNDGTNWESQEEMNTASITDMDLYDDIELIPDDKTCVGIYMETISGAIRPDEQWVDVLLKIKDTAEIGKTYGMTQRTWMWIEPLDRNIYTITNKDLNYLDDWPALEWDSGNANYIKTEYDEYGNKVSGTHSGGRDNGNTILVVGANLHGKIRAVDSNNEDKINYDLGRNENIITYSIEPVLDENKNLLAQIENVTIKSEVTLPKGLTYKLGSSTRAGEQYTEPEITENENGTTTLVWYIYGATSGQTIEPLLFEAQISNNSNNGVQYESKLIVSEKIGTDGISKIGTTNISLRTSTESINIINLASFRLYKEVEHQVIEKNGKIHFILTGTNNTESELPDFALLDIMPYNGDNRETLFDGTYTISKIVIKQSINGTTIDNSNLTFYITKQTTQTDQPEQYEAIKALTAKDTDIGTSEIWQQITETNGEYLINQEQANNGITAIAVKGELSGLTEIILDIYLETNGNKPEDKYVNSSTAQTQTITEVVQTSYEYAQVVGRSITGKVWLDTNYNSIIDNNELLGDINKDEIYIKLYKENAEGTIEEAIDVDGNVVQAINPDETGYYEFNNLPAENFIIKVEYDDNIYNIVEKEVGANAEINSKFKEDTTGIGKTETLTKLNSLSNIKLEETNINIGLTKQINLEYTKVAEEDYTNKIGGAEFKIYKLICTTHEEGYHDNEQIDTTNVDTNCWELVNTQTSNTGTTNAEETGKVEIKDLKQNTEYRLIETKAGFNRIKPEGQWKIKFVYVENKNETDLIINDNIEIQITAIGNPPAFIKQNGELLLPNKAYFQFPTSGSLGSKTIYQTGLLIIALGVILLIIRKKRGL